ncbi:DUF455 family protein [Sandaracinus amylolyticus]|uniref:DUF455 family protein n=1 Tax=Sandaracinus amylolyticus TaxID=927083 RepID=UPI001F43DC92|nr:DUF455 family protein [Sandaracinus amylolyticus]UJR85823.1 Hypothetical protein I5071_79030 [Sandaracinus amylolyticus]
MDAPREGTVERWAWDYVLSTDLAHKLAPPPVPRAWEDAPRALRIDAPGRPDELVRADKRAKTPRPEALRDARKRAELLHVFAHHELQAAELMCRALLLFVERDPAFRRGLLRIALDEVRHLAMYDAHLRALGFRFGSFPVRDWFWERVPAAESAESFVAMLGVGFEGANLDHTRRFADAFRAVGDEEGARLQEIVGDEEVPHVRFAVQWLERWSGGALELDAWRARLPAPITPIVMRGRPLDRARRARAGMDEAFVDALDRWMP